jgi:hypothetical protein
MSAQPYPERQKEINRNWHFSPLKCSDFEETCSSLKISTSSLRSTQDILGYRLFCVSLGAEFLHFDWKDIYLLLSNHLQHILIFYPVMCFCSKHYWHFLSVDFYGGISVWLPFSGIKFVQSLMPHSGKATVKVYIHRTINSTTTQVGWRTCGQWSMHDNYTNILGNYTITHKHSPGCAIAPKKETSNNGRRSQEKHWNFN